MVAVAGRRILFDKIRRGAHYEIPQKNLDEAVKIPREQIKIVRHAKNGLSKVIKVELLSGDWIDIFMGKGDTDAVIALFAKLGISVGE